MWDRGVGGGITIEEYIIVYFLPNTEKIGSQFLVNSIQSLSLKVIVLVLGRIVGIPSLHQASMPLMFYLVECMRHLVYDWSTSLLSTMKQQLTNYRLGMIKNFGFTSILSNFFFERVPGLKYRVKVLPHSL